jgi:hypothetical protein
MATFSILITLLILLVLYTDSVSTSHRTPCAYHTGHTQKNGAVSKVNTVDTAPFFCVCPVYIFEPKGIRMLGQPRKYKRYKIFCISTTIVKRRYCSFSVATMVCERGTILRYSTWSMYLCFLPMIEEMSIKRLVLFAFRTITVSLAEVN